MTLNGQHPGAEDLTKALAAMTGETVDEAAIADLSERLRQLEDLPLVDAIMEIAHHCASLPIYDDRTADEILGYDENGLPRDAHRRMMNGIR